MVIDRRQLRNELAHLLALLMRQPDDVVAKAN
jgi:acetyl-CoA carboxylase carboxyl transferase subunit beta